MFSNYSHSVLTAILVITLLTLFGCSDDDELTEPAGPEHTRDLTLTTSDVSNITTNAAVCGGEILSDGGANVVTRGVCWSLSAEPTVNDDKTVDGGGLGSFTSSITGLDSDTPYYVRAYATTNDSTFYGSEKSFRTTSSSITSTGW